MSHDPLQLPLFRSLQRLRAAFWRRRVAQWLIRAAWLALLVPTLFMAGYLWLGWQVRWYDWAVPMLGLGLGAILWAIRPIALPKMAHRLDRRLGLRARLITALEASRAPQHAENLVVQRLLQETVSTLVDLRRYVWSFGRGFWLEAQVLIAVAALLSAMLILDALTFRTPHASPVELPASWQEPAADEVIPPDPELFPPPFPPEPQIQASSQEQIQQALEALAEALRDQAATRSIAEALDRGDLAGAAEGLRRLADQLGGLSEQARSELGEALQGAAEEIGSEAPELSQPLQEGSNSLSSDNLGAAGQALEELAEALDELSETPPETAQTQPQEGNEPGEASPSEPGESQEPAEASEEQNQAGEPGDGSGSGEGEGEGSGGNQPTEAERLGVEGQPLELESDSELEEQVLQPAELDAEAGDEQTEDSPFARQPLNVPHSELGPDPLTYPWEKRDVIRRYFTPE